MFSPNVFLGIPVAIAALVLNTGLAHASPIPSGVGAVPSDPPERPCTQKEAFFYGPWSHCKIIRIPCPKDEMPATNTKCMRYDE